MAPVVDYDVKDAVLSNTTFGPQEIKLLQQAIAADFSNYRPLREAVDELQGQTDRSPATSVRLGVCYYLLGRYQKSIETLKQGDGGALAHFYLGKANFALEDYPAALTGYTSAQKAGYDADTCTLAKAEALRYSGDGEGSLKLLDSLSGAVEQTAEYLSQRAATVATVGGSPEEVTRLFERAVEADNTHPGALFGLAREADRRGNDAQALDLYQRATTRVPANVGSLLNLGVLYEDNQQYERARQCYQRILEVYPNHPRARLFLKDADASRDMYYD